MSIILPSDKPSCHLSSGNNVPRPAPMPVRADVIPARLRALRRWVCWRWVWSPKKNGGKGGWDKPLYNPRTGRFASSTDPTSWNDFDTCLAAHRRGEYDGVGFVLGFVEEEGLTLVGLDLDDVRDAQTGEMEEWSNWALRQLDSYAEVSPSWTGVKALAWGELPSGRRVSEDRHVEMYSTGRYFTVTGHRLDDVPAEVMQRDAMITTLHALLIGPETGHQQTEEDATAASAHSSLTIPATSKPDDRVLALSALAGLSARRADAYSDWLGVGMALHSVDSSSSMCAAWDHWSRRAPDKYEEGACARKWKTFTGGGGLSIGSLLHWARLDGWTPPGSGCHKAQPPAQPAALRPEQHVLVILDHLRQSPHHARVLAAILRDAEKGVSNGSN